MKISRRRWLGHFVFPLAQQSSRGRNFNHFGPGALGVKILINHVPGAVTELGNGNAIGPEEGPSVLKVLLDSKSAFMHQRVMPRAQQHEVLEIRFTTVRPVLDMVIVQKSSIMAAWEGAAVTVPRP